MNTDNTNELIAFESYLQSKSFTKGSIKSYIYQVEHFIKSNPGCKDYQYKNIIDALELITKHKANASYRIAILASIKKYYDYLIESGKRSDHPCRQIFIKHNRNTSIIHNDLFSSAELELLMNREERYENMRLKNQVIISLLIYQGLTASEIANLKVQHINLDESKIFVKESRDLMRRHLDLHPKQFMIFNRYINESRKKLLKTESDVLVISMRGQPISVSEISYLTEQFKILFPGRSLNAGTIRQSVIANWLNEKKLPLETVQLMAGHRWISSTARYRRNSTEEKRTLINRFHPLG